MKYHILTLALLLFSTLAVAQKQKISVLYVGGSADMETMGVMKIDSVKLKKSTKQRFNSFTKFLSGKFKTVKAIYAEDYTPEMSDRYDVTVFDGRPKAWRERVVEYGPDGRMTKYQKPAYLPFDFSRPALMIANASEDLGRSIGTKNDWYCLCLNAHALGWKKDHPIFKGPFKVNIKPEMRPTPATAFDCAKVEGISLPEQTEMWRVHTVSYETTPEYRIGMVSRPGGYLDSPETEVISGGECAKSIDAIAIGRHANFLHWGFSASPDYLTAAGKAALANAIVYISKFKNEHVVARKMNENIATRHYTVASKKYSSSREAWQDYNEQNKKFYATIDSISKSAKEKRARGEELNSTEMIYVDFDMGAMDDAPTYSEYVKQREPQLYHVFGDDSEAYTEWYEKNAPYLYPTSVGYNLDVDEDVRSLAIANNDKQLLDKCIKLLEEGQQTELARRILHRYTLCRFATAEEWRNWYDTYQDQLFFTESGGWLWLVNTQDRSVPGNDYRVLETENPTVATLPSAEGQLSKDNPVELSAAMVNTPDGAKEIVVKMDIFTDFHTYGQVSSKDPFVPTTISISLPEGYQLAGTLRSPLATPLAKGSDTTVFTTEALFRQVISGEGEGEAVVTVSYQACDATMCYPPTEKQIKVQLK